MKKPFFIKPLEHLSNQELALYFMCMAIFLPFYLFLTLFALYMLLLLVTGKLKRVILSLKENPMLCIFIAYATLLSLLAGNWVGVLVCVFFLLYFIFFKYYQRIITPKLFHLIVQTLLLLSLVAVCMAFLEHFEYIKKFNYSFVSTMWRVTYHQNRAEATFFNPNYYGICCCFFIMIGGYYFYTAKQWRWRLLAILSCIANAVALNLTQSRTAFLAVFCGILVYVFTTIKNSKAFLITIAALMVVVALLFTSDLAHRMLTVGDSFHVRVSIWEAALELARANPLFGDGPMSYLFLHDSIGAPYHEHAHNLYIDTYLNYGYVGIGILFATLIQPIRSLFTLSKHLDYRPIVGLIGSFVAVVLAHGIFDLAILWVQSAFIFLLVFASLSMWTKQLTKNKE